MRISGSRGMLSLLLFLAAGALLGGILGHLLESANISGMIPYLTQRYEVFNFQNIYLNLSVIEIHFGIRFAPDLLSILGLLIAAWLYRRF